MPTSKQKNLQSHGHIRKERLSQNDYKDLDTQTVHSTTRDNNVHSSYNTPQSSNTLNKTGAGYSSFDTAKFSTAIVRDNNSNETVSVSYQEDPPPIYATPTTDTLGDDNDHEIFPFLVRPGTAQTPTRYRRPLDIWPNKTLPSSVSSVHRQQQQQPKEAEQGSAISSVSKQSSRVTTTTTMDAPVSAAVPSPAPLNMGSMMQVALAQSQQNRSNLTPSTTGSNASTQAAHGGNSLRAKQSQQQRSSAEFHEAVNKLYPMSTVPLGRTTTAVNEKSNSTGSVASSKRRPKRYRNRSQRSRGEFQHSEDYAKVSIRSVSIAQRSAFEVRPALPISEWHQYVTNAALELQRQKGARSQSDAPAATDTSSINCDTSLDATTSSSLDAQQMIRNMMKRVSPSLQHLELLHKMQSKVVVRQADFSPSVGIDSDLLVHDGDEGMTTKTKAGVKEIKFCQQSQHCDDDGRYRSIDPVKATMSVLPSTAPALSNKKLRLPLRTDVGFPNAHASEIEAKQKEIICETEWEEASPRLVVLVTSDDMGKAVQEENVSNNISTEHIEWNAGGLKGMPFAGRDLIRAKEQNAKHFGLRGTKRAGIFKTNPYSAIAPPLDASYSASQGWKPRPFHDRQPGLKYFMVCPTDVSFGIGSVEPLVCSLTLFSLPVGQEVCKNEAWGKMSEDFWFPAGDWKGKIQLESTHTVSGIMDQNLVEFWTNRKQKAIFSYHPLSTTGGLKTLYLILQVYKTAQPHAAAAYFASSKERHSSLITENDALQLRLRSNRSYQQNGMSLKSPLCFGLVPILSNGDCVYPDGLEWPQAVTREMELFSFPPFTESHDDFLSRLTFIANSVFLQGLSYTMPINIESRSFVSEGTPSVSSTGSSDTMKKKRGTTFLNRSSTKVKEMSNSTDKVNLVNNALIDGKANVLISLLPSDFLQSMLSTPTALHENTIGNSNPLPRLLADVTGDCAVILNPNQANSTAGPHASKRSSLLRLPVPKDAAGYTCASEFREVLRLPARPEKRYDVDYGFSYRSLLDLLYLYPRSLCRPSGNTTKKNSNSSYTIRIRLLNARTDVNKSSRSAITQNQAVCAFYNPAPWIGKLMLNEVYTSSMWEESQLSSDLDFALQIRDEIKLRLPPVLDSCYTLEFSLFSITPVDTGVSLCLLEETAIPLSTSSSGLQNCSTARVTTVIPNGIHRLKLGDFVFSVETRLLSATHVGDPAIATILRDFPCARDSLSDVEYGVSQSFLKNSSLLLTEDTYSDCIERLVTVMSTALDSSVAGHFELLLHMHLGCLLKQGENVFSEVCNESKFLMLIVKCLFEVFRKVKSKFKSSWGPGGKQLSAFLKLCIDLFDEGYFSQTAGSKLLEEASSFNKSNEGSKNRLQLDLSESNDDIIKADDDEDWKHEGAIRIRSRKGQSLQHELRVTRIIEALGPSSIPFSRIAYGASKLDRMRIEAELKNDEDRFAHFFDDDETVATAQTFSTTPDRRIFGKRNDATKTADDSSLSHTIIQSSSSAAAAVAAVSAATHDKPTESFRSNSSTEFANRMKNAAQVMLAPCVGPSFPNILAGARASSPVLRDGNENQEDSNIIDAKSVQIPYNEDTVFTQIAGSDVEGDFYSADKIDMRGPVFVLTVESKDDHNIPVGSGAYLYESIIVVWLRAWVDYVENSFVDAIEKPSPTERQFATFAVPPYDPSAAPPYLIFSFYAHMDILLPLCLKSFVIRYSQEVLPLYSSCTRAVLDDNHTHLLEPFVEMLARGLIGMALAGMGSLETRDKALLRALRSSEYFFDFMTGLVAILHPVHIHVLIKKFLRTLRECETEHLGENFAEMEFEWNEESLHRVRCSRHLRLRLIEAFAVLPCFVALNHPPKYSGNLPSSKTRQTSWLRQFCEIFDRNQTNIEECSANTSISGGWLAELLTSEGLSICALSCEAVVAEAMAHIEVTTPENGHTPNSMSLLRSRAGASLKRCDLLMFQSIAVHAISCVYELILRRHSMDKRYQTESCRERVASLFAKIVLDKSIESVRWLARMESTHKVRSLWLLCFVCVLQEAPEIMIRDYVRLLCNPMEVRIHRFVRLLRLCTSSFQSFLDLPRHSQFPSEIDKGLSPWLLQESFNTVCAATNTVVEECVHLTSSYPDDQEKIMIGILDLLLHLLTTPQSSVTHLRAVGGALQALDFFKIELFLDTVAGNLQHWIRVILSLMNSTSLSVRSIAVDFIVQLFGSAFHTYGNVDGISLIFLTVLPEVSAREIALHSVSGHILTTNDTEAAIWPLRRSIADLEDANPLDDDRIDPQLAPVLTVLCRACQAIMDGVLIEMRLNGPNADVVGTKIAHLADEASIFDADEESLFEAATSFAPETSPLQRLRWLLTLKRVHEKQGQWVEAAETLFLCARTISDSIPHLKSIWRPSKFILWSDSRRSLWLDTVGEEMGVPDRGNAQVMKFADQFLEPANMFGAMTKASATGQLPQPTVLAMSSLLIKIEKEAIELYRREVGTDEIAYAHLENLLRNLIGFLDNHNSQILPRSGNREISAVVKKQKIEFEAAVRRVIASISGDMTKLAENLLVTCQEEESFQDSGFLRLSRTRPASLQANGIKYVVLLLRGKKPPRFQESTALPTFLEFDVPCICRLPEDVTKGLSQSVTEIDKELCAKFAHPYIRALRNGCGTESIVLKLEPVTDSIENSSETFLHVFPVDVMPNTLHDKTFYFRKGAKNDAKSVMIEMTVVHPFPCLLSRQRSILTTEIFSTQSN